VGHTADDQAETLILNWLRGSGLTGLTGMRPLAGGIARPLLGLRRGDTHAYCASRGWQPRVDATNADDRFARNRVRHQLLPALKSFNSNLVPTLVRNAELLAEDESYLEATAADALEELAGSVTEDEVALDGARLLALPAALRRRVVRQAAALLMGGPADGPSRLDARHIALVAALAATHSAGSAVELPGGLVAAAERERVVLRRRAASRSRAVGVASERALMPLLLPVPGSVELPEMGWRVRALLLDAAAGAVPPGMEAPRVGGAGSEDSGHEDDGALTPAAGTAADAGRAQTRAYLDADAAGEPLFVRGWLPGDRFQPLGMTGERKLQDFFVDAKVPRDERGRIPLVWGPRHLLWIAGYRIDERARLTDTTQRVLALRLEPLDGSDTEPEEDDAEDTGAGTEESGEIVEIWEANPEAAGFGEAPEGGGSEGAE
jgi:tRNA(Ile)-lysidine synthase